MATGKDLDAMIDLTAFVANTYYEFQQSVLQVSMFTSILEDIMTVHKPINQEEEMKKILSSVELQIAESLNDHIKVQSSITRATFTSLFDRITVLEKSNLQMKQDFIDLEQKFLNYKITHSEPLLDHGSTTAATKILDHQHLKPTPSIHTGTAGIRRKLRSLETKIANLQRGLENVGIYNQLNQLTRSWSINRSFTDPSTLKDWNELSKVDFDEFLKTTTRIALPNCVCGEAFTNEHLDCVMMKTCSKLICQKCGSFGHNTDQCISKFLVREATNIPWVLRCLNCGNLGHISGFCPGKKNKNIFKIPWREVKLPNPSYEFINLNIEERTKALDSLPTNLILFNRNVDNLIGSKMNNDEGTRKIKFLGKN